jgi:hypothetical protein
VWRSPPGHLWLAPFECAGRAGSFRGSTGGPQGPVQGTEAIACTAGDREGYPQPFEARQGGAVDLPRDTVRKSECGSYQHLLLRYRHDLGCDLSGGDRHRGTRGSRRLSAPDGLEASAAAPAVRRVRCRAQKRSPAPWETERDTPGRSKRAKGEWLTPCVTRSGSQSAEATSTCSFATATT